MKLLLLRMLGRRALKRWLNRKSPKVSLAGGSAAAVVITGVLSAFVDPDTAALIAAPLATLATTAVNLMWGDEVDDESPSEG